MVYFSVKSEFLVSIGYFIVNRDFIVIFFKNIFYIKKLINIWRNLICVVIKMEIKEK